MASLHPPTKSRVCDSLRRMAVLMQYRGDNVFRTRAFETAAEALGGETASLAELASEPGRLEEIKGIGRSIADFIREAASTADGVPDGMAQLMAECPAGLFEMVQVPGLGLKKIRALHESLGVGTMEDLRRAAESGAMAELPGFGKKSAEKIVTGMDSLARFAGRVLVHKAEAAAAPLLALLRGHPDVTRAEGAGSLRRRRETIGDLDFVAASDAPGEVMDAFMGAPGVASVIGRGPTKCSVTLDDGMQADLRVVPDSEFASALQYFTGSKEHNVALRVRAVGMGLRLNEYGLFHDTEASGAAGGGEGDGDGEAGGGAGAAGRRARRLADAGAQGAATAGEAAESAKRSGERVATPDEAALYGALGLDWIPPELREGLGELEAASARALPALVRDEDYRGVLHNHTTWSDGADSVLAMALAARDTYGWEYIALCDHSQAAAYAGGVKAADLPRVRGEIDAANAELARGGSGGSSGDGGGRPFRILVGTEVDIMGDGSLDYFDADLAPMDFVVASVHSRFTMSADEMTERLVKAVCHPKVHCLGHVSGRLLLARDPYEFDLEAVLRACADTGTAIEINADPHRLDLDWRFHRRAKEMGCRFAVNPDAHSTGGLANVRHGLDCARKGGLTAGDIVNCLPLGEFLRWRDSVEARKRG